MALDGYPRRVLLPSLVLLALMLPTAAAGQVLTTIEFSFSNPGARSLGFGGAFVALADDATAAFANPATFRPERLSHTVRADAGGTDMGFALGFLYGPTPRWKLGGVYRQGPDLDLAIGSFAGPAHPEFAPGERFIEGSTPWTLPDVYGLGVSYRSTDGRCTGSFEWSRVEYSTILEALEPELRDPGNVLDDADELHLGGEYAFFIGRSVMAIRLGAWHDPDHQPRNESTQFSRAESPGGSDELHLTAGFGLAFDKIQMDLGIDISELRDTAAVSLIYSF